MELIGKNDSQYQILYETACKLFNSGRVFPDNIPEDSRFILTYLSINIFDKIGDINFHELICDFLAQKEQSHYYILPLWYKMDIVKELPIIKFSKKDSNTLYSNFWDKESHAELIENFIHHPDSFWMFNENLDWFFFEDSNGIGMGLFAFRKNDMAKFIKSFDPAKVDFCSENTITDLVSSTYKRRAEAIEQFNKWIKPRLVYLKENGDD